MIALPGNELVQAAPWGIAAVCDVWFKLAWQRDCTAGRLRAAVARLREVGGGGAQALCMDRYITSFSVAACKHRACSSPSC